MTGGGHDAVRVLLVDDDPLLRAGLRLMLQPEPTVDLVAEAADGDEVLAAVDRHRPDVVLMDVRMARVDGVAATRLLQGQPDPPAVLVLTTLDTDDLVVRALEAGARGFLLKDTPPDDVIRAIQVVASGESMLSPSVASQLVSMVAGDGEAGARRERARSLLAGLSPREREVAMAIARGEPNADIAAALHVSVGTVKGHITQLMEKLEATNRVQIAVTVHEASPFGEASSPS
jgi:DNA-binding NarL/FixJ family response regulator